MNVFRQALQEFSKGSNARIIWSLAVVGAVVAGLSFGYVYFIARHHQQNFLLAYLVPLLLLAAAGCFLIAGYRSKRGWEGLILVVLALFTFFAAVISFVVTLILLIFVY